MTSELDEDKDSGYLLVKRNGEVIANYPIDKLNELANRFKDKDICSSSEFEDYASLDDFVDSIYFIEFLEYFLYHLHRVNPDLIFYKNYKNKKNLESRVYDNSKFKSLMYNCINYLNGEDFNFLLNAVNIDYNALLSLPTFGGKQNEKVKQLLIRLYLGFICFLKLLIKNDKLDLAMTYLLVLKNKTSKNKSKKMFNNSVIHLFKDEKMLELRKNLLSIFRLFQRKYLSAIAKLRRIGAPNDSKEKSQEFKKELNKNKNFDYKAYEVFCKYVLSKEKNEDIYDFLAGIHKNINGSVIHKNINNNTVVNIKTNTKKKHHKDYIERSEKILEMVEDKIKEHGDIIDIKTKNQVERIRKLFNSNEYKNFTLSFGNNLPILGGNIIQDCKTIRIINKEIDKMIKEHMNKEHNNQKQEKREEVLTLLDNLKQRNTLKNNANTTREKIVRLLGYDLLRKTKKLSQKEINTINQIQNKLNKILPKS
jgi:hypothetical protein